MMVRKTHKIHGKIAKNNYELKRGLMFRKNKLKYDQVFIWIFLIRVLYYYYENFTLYNTIFYKFLY